MWRNLSVFVEDRYQFPNNLKGRVWTNLESKKNPSKNILEGKTSVEFFLQLLASLFREASSKQICVSCVCHQ